MYNGERENEGPGEDWKGVSPGTEVIAVGFVGPICFLVVQLAKRRSFFSTMAVEGAIQALKITTVYCYLKQWLTNGGID